MMRKFFRFLKRVAIFISVVAAIGFIYQWIAVRRDRALYPPPGEIIEVNNQSYHIICRGEVSAESPTIVIEAGRDSSSTHWMRVIEQVAEFNHVCTYDRTGLGWSAPSAEYLDSFQVNDNLHALLRAANVEPPYLLVGHSIGGILVRDYYHKYPQDVAGIVLVDSSSTKQYRDWVGSEGYYKSIQWMKGTAPLGTAISHFGVFRLYRAFRYDTPPEEYAALARRNEPHYFRTRMAELLMVRPMVGRPEEPEPLGDLPLRVIEQTIKPTPDMPEWQVQMKAEWHELQKDIAALSTDSQLIEAPRSGHDIATDDPDLIVEVIREILTAMR